MKFFENKKFFQKMIISILIITITTFIFSSKVKAKDDGPGGKLLRPVASLLLSLDDGFMDVIHNHIVHQNKAYIMVDLTGAGGILGAIGIGLLVAAGVAVIVCAAVVAVPAIIAAIGAAGAGGAAAAAAAGSAAKAAIVTTAGTILAISVGSGVVGGYAFAQNELPDDMALPLYSVTPEEIISGNLTIFDADFFNPSTEMEKENITNGLDKEYCTSLSVAISKIEEKYKLDKKIDEKSLINEFKKLKDGESKKLKVGTAKIENAQDKDIYIICEKGRYLAGAGEVSFDKYYIGVPTQQQDSNSMNELTVEQCSGISGAISIIKEKYNININEKSINFGDVSDGSSKRIKVGTTKDKKGVYIILVKGTQVMGAYGAQPTDDKYYVGVEKSSSSNEPKYLSIAMQLRSTVASWYKTLRNIAIVGSLSILIYIAIRIIISSSSEDKAKYKQRLYDWLISICLIFIMHYIMAGSNIFVKKLSGLLNSVQKPSYCAVVYDCDKEKIQEALENNEEMLADYYGQNVDIESFFTQEDGKDCLAWSTNLMGTVRMQAQRVKDANGVTFAGYAIMFTVLTIFTGVFTWSYLRRIAYLALLTILAPFVAMTYALDKLKDGSAQGFNNWFKEYIVNLLIQPIHLLLYTVLVSSAIQLAETNIVYSIVALGFMIPAEKLVRRFFGINATETQGLLAGPAGGALAMAGLNKLLSHRPPNLDDGANTKNTEIKDKISYKDSLEDETKEIFDGASILDNSIGDDVPSNSETETDTVNTIPKTISTSIEDTDMPDENIDINPVTEAMPEEDYDNSYIRFANDSNSTPVKPSSNKIQTNSQPKRQIKNPKVPKANTTPRNTTIPKTRTKPRTTDIAVDQDKPKIKPSIWNGLKRGAKFYGRGVLNNIDKNWKPGQSIKKAARMASGIGVGALAGLAGASAGIATGDIKSTWQDAGAGALGGYKLGSALNYDVPSSLKVPDAAEYFERGMYGDEEYEKMQRDKVLQKMEIDRMNDEFIKEFALRTKMNEEQAKKYLKQDNFLKEGLRYGFSDANEFATAKMAKDDTGDQKKAFAHTKMVKDYGSDLNKLENDREAKDSYLRALSDRFSYKMDRDEDGNIINKKALEKTVNALYEKQLKYSKEYYKK